MKKLIIKSKHIAKKNSSNYKHEKKQGTKDLQNSEKAIKWQQQILINSYFKVNELNSLIRRHNSQMDFLKQIEKEKSGEQDGGGVGGRGACLSPWIHQEYNFRHRSACRTPAESGQEYLTSGKKYKNHTKLSKTKELGRKIGVLVGLNLDVLIQHQGHKPYCRYGLLNSIALLSLG